MSRLLTDEQLHLLNDYDPAFQAAGLGTLIDELLRDKSDAVMYRAPDALAADTQAESGKFMVQIPPMSVVNSPKDNYITASNISMNIYNCDT